MSTCSSGGVVPVDVQAWTDAGTRLVQRGIARGDSEKIRQAVARFEAVFAACPPGNTGHGPATANLANALVVEFEMTSREEALGTAIRIMEEIEPDSAEFGDRKADYYAVLGHALLRDAERTALPETADRAVGARRKALELTSKHDPGYPGRLSDLGAALAVQFRFTSNLAVLQEAVRVHRRATRDESSDDVTFPGRLSNLGTCLDDLAMNTSDAKLQQRAVDVQREAKDATTPGHPLAPMIASNLGNSLEHLYELTGARSALEEAIERHRQTIAWTPADHLEYCPRLANLAVALQSMYERTGELGDLEEAIDTFRDAVDRTPEDFANRLKYLHGDASALMRMAERTGDLSEVAAVITLWGTVVDATLANHPAKPGRLSALATANFLLFQRDPSDLSTLDKAIDTLREAVAIVPDGHSQQAMVLSNLGVMLDSRFEWSGERTWLDEALLFHERAVDATPLDHSDRGAHMSNFGIALLHLAGISEDSKDATHAANVLITALTAQGSDDPRRALTLHALGSARAREFELGKEESLSLGLEALAEAADMDIAPVAVRVRAYREGGRLAATGGATDDALARFGAAVRLMEEAAWAGMSSLDQQRLLTELNGLPMEAAAMAIEKGQLNEAIELLEQGRAILLDRQLSGPTLQAQLWSRAPALAEEFAWVQKALEGTAGDDPRLTGSETLAPPSVVGHARQSRLARQRAEILDQIRQKPELRDLVDPPRFDRLAEAANGGPVVIVNISQYRCDAMTVSAGQVRLIPLAGLTAEGVAEYVEKLREGADSASREQVDEVLRWTWDRIVAPVFSDLDVTEPKPGGEDVHVWWCATGLSSFLPLHAAGSYQDENLIAGNALDLAISSFTPTLRILIHLMDRHVGEDGSDPGPLVVAMPETPGLNDLESPEREAAYLSDRLASLTVLKGASATCDVVADAMTRHRWAHFSCHGSQDLRHPYRAALHLHDGPLAVPKIMGLDLSHPALAFLSACDTSIGGIGIPDEAITLTSALQIAGYKHVIGTLWPISGLTASEIARGFYEQILSECDGTIELHYDMAAAALRSTLRAIRDKSPDLPALYWAAYVHSGP